MNGNILMTNIHINIYNRDYPYFIIIKVSDEIF